MATQSLDKQQFSLARYLPGWLVNYKRDDLAGDLVAGIIVAVMLVPQSMAYALLAGLPPEVGLYASIMPPLIYGLLGSSRTLAVGPVALDSLLVAAGISQLNPATSADYLMLATILALQIGLIQVALGAMRFGFIVNFLSRPVLSGFMSAAAIVIAVSQLKHILGINIPRSEHFHEDILYALNHLHEVNPAALGITVISVLILMYFKMQLGQQLHHIGLRKSLCMFITKLGALVIIVIGTLAVVLFDLDIAVVGDVPVGLPHITPPLLDMQVWLDLLPTALTISLIGFMESISVGKSLASKKRQKVDANQELMAVGAANIGAAFTGGYPVAGGLSRSVVNFSAGANTGLASMITAGLIALTVLFLTPLFYHLPQAVLAAIIIMAVVSLLDIETFITAWRYNRADGISLLVTFFTVLFVDIQTGIIIGAVVSIGMYLYQTSKPHIAVVGRIGQTEHFRNVLRHEVQTHPNVLLMRVDESLYFPNAAYLEEQILGTIADNPNINHMVLVCSAVNFIDSSALNVLESLLSELKGAKVQFYLAEVKGPVMDRLRAIGFIDKIGEDHIFLSTHQAFEKLCSLC